MPADVDLLILGGGCAGLSLAMRLAENPGACRRVVVLEARERYENDRSWCFWQDRPDRFDTLVTYRWNHLAVRSSRSSASLRCAATPYQMLEAAVFYDHAQQVIRAHNGVQLHLGVTLSGLPPEQPDGWRIETPLGTLRAARIVDTRPARRPVKGDALLWQSFLGHEVLCDRSMFDPGCVELMDFADGRPGTVEFTYVLPLAADRALVETTVFDPQPYGPADLAARQHSAVLKRVRGAAHSVVRTENGILPMGDLKTAPDGSSSRYCAAGLHSGAARPATGYAFQRIQRWAEACAATLRLGGNPIPHASDPWLTQQMDRLFLQVLAAEPERAADLFVRLFARVPAPRLIRFLSDKATLADRASVVAALPPALFLRHLLRTGFRPATGRAHP